MPAEAGYCPLLSAAEDFMEVASAYDSNVWFSDPDYAYHQLMEAYIALGVHIYQRQTTVIRARSEMGGTITED